MIKGVLLLSICIICFSGCSQKSETVFHQDPVIDNILQKYNTLATIKIGKEDISNEFSYQVFFELDGVWIRISHNDNLKKVFITFEQESRDLNTVKKYCYLFLKTLDQKISVEDINTVFKELETYNYKAYETYKYGDFDFTLTKDKLMDSNNCSYSLKSSFIINQ